MPPKKVSAATKTNGGLSKKKKSKSTSAAAAAPPQQTSSTGLSIFVAVIAFFALGVLSPPSFHAVRYVTQLDLSSSSSAVDDEAQSLSTTTTLTNKLQLPPNTPCTSSNLANYIHDTPVPGLHIVCIDSLLSDAAEANPTLRFAFFQNAIRPKLYQRKKLTAGGTTKHSGGVGVGSIDWNEVKQLMVNELKLTPEGPRQQPWAVFTPLGERIVGENDVVSNEQSSIWKNKQKSKKSIKSNAQIVQELASSGMVLVFQGGNWRWPGVREGFQRTVELSPKLDFTTTNDSAKRNITIETLSMTPLVVSIKGFLSDQECDHIASAAEPNMKYSGVSLKDVDKGKAASNWRTSQSAFLRSDNDPILTAIDHRTASLTRLPKVHQEILQVLRYGTSEKYDAHHDYFDPKDYRSDKNTLDLIENGKKNRFATVFWYLTTVKEGGETIFPNYQNKPLPRGYAYSDCDHGLKVKPQKGKVIIFYSLDARGQMDPLSLHGACPVIGEDDVKWAANKWIWSGPMGFTADDD
eukprot:CAMPEP_0201690598 /NCGR_PEP_ID=MMETSP0578-20130828/4014_1 /ASSEMBLY_ACC=CAM_ASM_000663 /TAXON_ID=267565 /ORGANISM="Skeletonema grethea, Strain CCMP 1804" /LENGTH=520 /DNA_ID=CAMNT_0048175639 /DNA_START=96 /DNA_END=1658 /DNA_ORIENTATION=-